MKLTKHLSQGKLVYLSRSPDAISVFENEHFRWLSFDNTLQSIMLKRKPWLLTLPHQIAILLPLLIFRPQKVIELGLGGGNLSRFIAKLDANIHFTSIEENSVVISCFNEYFNPDNVKHEIINHCGLTALTQLNIKANDWLISDIFRHDEFSFSDTIKQLEALVDQLTPSACLTINIPDITAAEINLCLTVLAQIQTSHQIIYFHVPTYRNIVMHLYPIEWRVLPLKNRNSYLDSITFNRWKRFWKYGILSNKKALANKC